VHYALEWQRRRGAENPIEGRVNEDAIAYAEQFERILTFSPSEVSSTIRSWMASYGSATDERAQKASEVRIENGLALAFGRAGAAADSTVLREKMANAREWVASPESPVSPERAASVQEAADRVVAILDLLEKKPAAPTPQAK
jgi:hypothetical protein